jgi:predicted TIM-barrel fold metal-dependent hydrolase
LDDVIDLKVLSGSHGAATWEFAEMNDMVVHIHPLMLSVGHEVLMVGRPFDSTVNGARMIGSGVFDRHPKLQVLIVHMGG